MRTPSREIDSTTRNNTKCSTSNSSVQVLCPSGGVVHASATNAASCCHRKPLTVHLVIWRPSLIMISSCALP